MKLPRGLSGKTLARALVRFGYVVVRQSSSHLRLQTNRAGVHMLTVPLHRALKAGTLNGILKDVAEHAGITRDELLRQLFP